MVKSGWLERIGLGSRLSLLRMEGTVEERKGVGGILGGGLAWGGDGGGWV